MFQQACLFKSKVMHHSTHVLKELAIQLVGLIGSHIVCTFSLSRFLQELKVQNKAYDYGLYQMPPLQANLAYFSHWNLKWFIKFSHSYKQIRILFNCIVNVNVKMRIRIFVDYLFGCMKVAGSFSCLLL